MFEPLADRSITLADGRRLAFAEWGDLGGPVVVFFHGTPHSRLWCPDIAATRATGVHLVTVDRPGYGRSDPPPADLTMRGWTDDVSQLADTLHVDRVGVVGWSGGALYATACAAVIPERLSGAGEVGGAGWPVDEQPGALDDLDDADRRVYRARSHRSNAWRRGWPRSSPPSGSPSARTDPKRAWTAQRRRRMFGISTTLHGLRTSTRRCGKSVRQGPRCYAWDAVAGLGSVGLRPGGRHDALPPVARRPRPARTTRQRGVLGFPHPRRTGHSVGGLRALRGGRPLERDPFLRGRESHLSTKVAPNGRANAGSVAPKRQVRASAGAHAGEVGGDGVGGVAVEVGLGHVVAHGGARVGVAHGVFYVADADAGDQSGCVEGPAQAVRADRLAFAAMDEENHAVLKNIHLLLA